MIKVALVGAGGFLGARILEMARLGGPGMEGIEWVPVLRQFRALGRLARLGPVDFRLGDLSRAETLAPALAGCAAAVNLTMGDNRRFVGDVQNLHAACASAGVPTLVHLSSAEIYGRCDVPGLDDDSPWLRSHWMDYAREKGRTEDWLRSRPSGAGPAVIVLRPGLIWGPRSPWVAGPAQEIYDGVAGLVDGGKWACNLCFVDTLARAIAEAVRRPAPGFFNVGDPDRPTWREYYSGLCAAMGRTVDTIPGVPEAECRTGWADRLEVIKDSSWAKGLKRRFRSQTKTKVKEWLKGRRGEPALPSGIAMPRGVWWLQTTRYHLPAAKFRKAYPGAGAVSHAEAMGRTAAWLTFSGYGRD